MCCNRKKQQQHANTNNLPRATSRWTRSRGKSWIVATVVSTIVKIATKMVKKTTNTATVSVVLFKFLMRALSAAIMLRPMRTREYEMLTHTIATQ
jgi:hypothetical protein